MSREGGAFVEGRGDIVEDVILIEGCSTSTTIMRPLLIHT